MTRVVRLAILMADTPTEPVKAVYGSYHDMFTRVFKDAANDLNQSSKEQIVIETDGFDVVTKQEYPNDISRYDGIIISGSKCSAYEDLPWIQKLKEFIKTVDKEYPKVKLFGVCFGHQAIAEALGGKVLKNTKGWEVGHSELKLTEDGEKVFGKSKKTFALNQMHQDEVTKIPEGFMNLASTDITTYQSMLKENHILTIQAHPEFPSDVVEKVISLRLKSGTFKQEDVDKWRSVLNLPKDSVWFIEKALLFILNKDLKDY